LVGTAEEQQILKGQQMKNCLHWLGLVFLACSVSTSCVGGGAVRTMTVHEAAEAGDIEQLRLHIADRADLDARNADGRTALLVATVARQPKAVELLALSGADIHATEAKIGWTVLHNEVLRGHIETARLLIAKGADVNALDNGHRAPIIWAAGGGQLPAVELLLDSGADIKTRTAMGWTPLHVAAAIAYGEMIALMLERGAEVDACDANGETPLHYSASKGHVAGAQLLIQHGADVNTKDSNGRTPLHYARANGHAAVVELLEKHCGKE